MATPFYISDGLNSSIRKVDATGNISTLAITSTDPVWIAKGGWVTPWGMAEDANGNLFVCDPGSNVIYKIDSTGNLTTAVGTGGGGFTGFPGPATSAQIANSYFCACDTAGNLYISNVNSSGSGMCVLAVNLQATSQTLLGISIASGDIAVVAGGHGIGYAGVPGVATSATFTNCYGVALDSTGNLFICSQGNSPGSPPTNQPSAAILKVDTSGNISKVAGDPTILGTLNSGDGGAATSAGLGTPIGIALDSSGNLYITGTGESAWSSVRAVNTQGTTQTILGISIGAGKIQTVAGSTTAQGYSGDGGAAVNALLGKSPWSSTLDSSGNLYIVDTANNVIRLVSTAGVITTSVGFFPGAAGDTGDGGLATAATLHSPFNLAIAPTSVISSITIPVTLVVTAPTAQLSIPVTLTVHGCTPPSDGRNFLYIKSLGPVSNGNLWTLALDSAGTLWTQEVIGG